MSLKSPCSYCKKNSRLVAKGLCGTCYARQQRNGTPEYIRPNRSLGVRECSHCQSPNGPFVKSLCMACYQRQYKNGSPEMLRVRHLCQTTGCDDLVKANGLCARHYARLRRHGNTQTGRPEGWGAKSAHPQYESWQSMRRLARRKGGFDQRWNDFWVFLEDVGDRPSDKHRLYRKDEAIPFSKDNCEWQAPIAEESQLKDNAAYQRAWRLKRGDVSRDWYLRNTFGGLTTKDYNILLEAQNGVCAICHQPETAINPRTGQPFPLAVDHCHEAERRGEMKVRGLLCARHNQGLGLFGDSVALLRAAIAYLESHGATT